MVSLVALAFVAIVAPVLAVPIVLVAFRYGARPPTRVLAALAVALALPGLGFAVAVDAWTLQTVGGTAVTVLAGLSVFFPRYVASVHVAKEFATLASLWNAWSDPDEGGASLLILARAINVLDLPFGLYLTISGVVDPTVATTMLVDATSTPSPDGATFLVGT